jgi:hypothetical protein
VRRQHENNDQLYVPPQRQHASTQVTLKLCEWI